MGDFTLETVKSFIISNGGSVQNSKLVTHFKDVLNDPIDKVANREKFKNYVVELVTIKVVEGEKILVLKKKYCQVSAPSPSALQEPLPAHSVASAVHGVGSEMDVDSLDGAMMSRARIDEEMEVRIVSTDRVPYPGRTPEDSIILSNLTGSTSSLTSSPSQKSLTSSTSGVVSMDEDADSSVISVKDKIKNLNRNISDSDLTRTRPGGPTGGNKKSHKFVGGEDDSSENPVTLDANQKDWLVVCASSDYHDMNKLLVKKPTLAKLKDLTNTALHWAAKSGKGEVIKMLASRSGIGVNQRSHGFTALHLAAIHGHDHILELLVQTYKADVNIRDHSGRKAKQYLKNTAPSKSKQLLASRKLGSEQGSVKSQGDSFARSSMRKSKSNKGVSSLLQAMSSVARPSMANWCSSLEEMASEKDGHAKPFTGCTHTPQDVNLMPPPSEIGAKGRRNSSGSRRSSSREPSPSSRHRNDENQDIMRSRSDSLLDKLSADACPK